MKRRLFRTAAVLFGAALLASTVPAAAVTASKRTTPQATVLATGLNGPRHLVAGFGFVVVAEAGNGGTLTCPNATQCLGRTGSVTLVGPGIKYPIISGLPSLGNQSDGGYAVGPADLAINNGELTVVMSNLASGVDPVTGANPFGVHGPEMGRLVHYPPALPPVAQLGADFGVYEVQNNPDGGAGAPAGAEKESNPYGMTAYGDGYAVVDAGANSLLWVRPNNVIQTIAALPTKVVNGQVVQSAPTAVEVGPDGALYVSEISARPGSARVYRVVPGQAPTVYADGFSLLTDLAFDSQGRLLVTSMHTSGAMFPPSQGAVIRVEANGSRTTYSTGIVSPTGITVAGPDIYVSNKGLQAGQGEVIKLRLP
ncbi:hypothetical protein AWW66_28330 [Micromonospora rosaria]|uniref:FlsU1 n=1 Tax=Micromonospora rosaria TaxID=47874 RepID=A0A0P0ISE4_9ACTN|nr:ScyD/ScyE family protein [Micromonospora rosaria]ALJ99862.1 FlsU1 [Micromonospora rosaria]KXK58685.1 hypothetical protein AWW66_28330 [Micromonospora rosaria]